MCLSRRNNTAGRAEICAAGTFLSFIRFSFLDRSRKHCQNIDPPGQQNIFYQKIQNDQYNSKIHIGNRKFPPEILLSGNHQKVAQWRRLQALRRTRVRRPDMFQKLDLSSKQDKKLLAPLEGEVNGESGKTENLGIGK